MNNENHYCIRCKTTASMLVSHHKDLNHAVRAVELIKELEAHFGVRWFVQNELENITLHTMKALVDKGHIERQRFKGLSYYRFKG